MLIFFSTLRRKKPVGQVLLAVKYIRFWGSALSTMGVRFYYVHTNTEFAWTESNLTSGVLKTDTQNNYIQPPDALKFLPPGLILKENTKIYFQNDPKQKKNLAKFLVISILSL